MSSLFIQQMYPLVSRDIISTLSHPTNASFQLCHLAAATGGFRGKSKHFNHRFFSSKVHQTSSVASALMRLSQRSWIVECCSVLNVERANECWSMCVRSSVCPFNCRKEERRKCLLWLTLKRWCWQVLLLPWCDTEFYWRWFCYLTANSCDPFLLYLWFYNARSTHISQINAGIKAVLSLWLKIKLISYKYSPLKFGKA